MRSFFSILFIFLLIPFYFFIDPSLLFLDPFLFFFDPYALTRAQHPHAQKFSPRVHGGDGRQQRRARADRHAGLNGFLD